MHIWESPAPPIIVFRFISDPLWLFIHCSTNSKTCRGNLKIETSEHNNFTSSLCQGGWTGWGHCPGELLPEMACACTSGLGTMTLKSPVAWLKGSSKVLFRIVSNVWFKTIGLIFKKRMGFNIMKSFDYL